MPPCRPHCSAICKTREVRLSIAFTRANTHCLRFRILPMHCHDFLMCSSSIGHTHRSIGHVDHRSAYGRNMAFNRCCTGLHAPPGFLASPPRASEHCTLQPGIENCCWCHLTSPDDVITPRQQPCKHLHISPSPRQRHIIGWRQWLCCSTRDSTQKPGTDPDQYSLTLNLDSWLWLFALTFEPKVKIFEMAYLAQFFV